MSHLGKLCERNFEAALLFLTPNSVLAFPICCFPKFSPFSLFLGFLLRNHIFLGFDGTIYNITILVHLLLSLAVLFLTVIVIPNNFCFETVVCD